MTKFVPKDMDGKPVDYVEVEKDKAYWVVFDVEDSSFQIVPDSNFNREGWEVVESVVLFN